MGEQKRKGESGVEHPIVEKHREQMNEIAHKLDRAFNGHLHGDDRETGFVLLIFPFGQAEEGAARANYISNSNRADIVVMLKEMVARFEGQAQQVSDAKH